MIYETKKIKCPICGTEMNESLNTKLYLCPEKRTIYLPHFGESIDYYDCALEIHADGRYTFQQYELPPYRVRIYDSWMRGTIITIIKNIQYDNHIDGISPIIQWKEAFQTDSALQLPWSDFDKCVQKLKLLTTFS